MTTETSKPRVYGWKIKVTPSLLSIILFKFSKLTVFLSKLGEGENDVWIVITICLSCSVFELLNAGEVGDMDSQIKIFFSSKCKFWRVSSTVNTFHPKMCYIIVEVFKLLRNTKERNVSKRVMQHNKTTHLPLFLYLSVS